MVLFPELDLMIVHRADTDTGRGVTDQDVRKLMDMILGARKGTPSRFADLGPVREEKLTDKEPKPLRNDYLAVSKKRRSKLVGRFMFSENTGMKLYEFRKRLFLQPVGMPLTDAEVFEVSDGSLRSPLVDLIIEPIESNGKKIDSIKMSFRGQTVTGKRTN